MDTSKLSLWVSYTGLSVDRGVGNGTAGLRCMGLICRYVICALLRFGQVFGQVRWGKSESMVKPTKEIIKKGLTE